MNQSTIDALDNLAQNLIEDNGLTIKEVKVLIDSLNWHIDQKKKGYRSVFD